MYTYSIICILAVDKHGTLMNAMAMFYVIHVFKDINLYNTCI